MDDFLMSCFSITASSSESWRRAPIVETATLRDCEELRLQPFSLWFTTCLCDVRVWVSERVKLWESETLGPNLNSLFNCDLRWESVTWESWVWDSCEKKSISEDSMIDQTKGHNFPFFFNNWAGLVKPTRRVALDRPTFARPWRLVKELVIIICTSRACLGLLQIFDYLIFLNEILWEPLIEIISLCLWKIFCRLFLHLVVILSLLLSKLWLDSSFLLLQINLWRCSVFLSFILSFIHFFLAS